VPARLSRWTLSPGVVPPGPYVVHAQLGNGNQGTVSVLLGNGDGTLATRTTYSVGGTPVSVTIADVNIAICLLSIQGCGEGDDVPAKLPAISTELQKFTGHLLPLLLHPSCRKPNAHDHDEEDNQGYAVDPDLFRC